MPVFRFNKAFGIARNLKVFLDLSGGIMREAVLDVVRYEEFNVTAAGAVYKSPVKHDVGLRCEAGY